LAENRVACELFASRGWKKPEDVGAIEQQFPPTETEREMNIQEVIWKAIAGKLKRGKAAEIIA
jgi:hypothetical protein